VATFFGLLSTGLAIILHDPVTGVAAWFYLLSRKPFDIGDRIYQYQLEGKPGQKPPLTSE